MNKIICGHSLDVLKTLESESVDCVITSPPYFGLRHYKTDPQIWGGRIDCPHEWENKLTKWHSDRGNSAHKEVFDRDFMSKGIVSEFVVAPIKATSPEGGLVLDPFCGTGTTLKIARALKRNYLGIDINPMYAEISEHQFDQKMLGI